MIPRFAAPLLAALLLAGGCATPRKLRVHAQASGRLIVHGEAVPRTELAAHLKSMGASPKTTILVVMTEDLPRPLKDSITSQLVSAGLPRVLFTGARTTSVMTKPR